MNIAPHELDMLISSTLIMMLIAFMVVIVYKDLIQPSKMSPFGAFLIVGVLLTAPVVFIIKNTYVLFASFNL